MSFRERWQIEGDASRVQQLVGRQVLSIRSVLDLMMFNFSPPIGVDNPQRNHRLVRGGYAIHSYCCDLTIGDRAIDDFDQIRLKLQTDDVVDFVRVDGPTLLVQMRTATLRCRPPVLRELDDVYELWRFIDNVADGAPHVVCEWSIALGSDNA